MGMKFKDKIMLYCYGKVKCKHGFTTGTSCYLYNLSGLLNSMCISGLVDSEWQFCYDDLGLFPGRQEYEFILQFVWEI